ncbi:MAG: tetratricopeptide repeat protein [FCB group bacterium]|nr:tetratricopeptide repeat protein [FCB group bacterium]
MKQSEESLIEKLADEGYWVAGAARCLEQGKYSEAVRLCKEHLDDEPDLTGGRLVYARALHRAGQIESAGEQFYRVLSRDPDNVVALKHLGDIRFSEGDEPSAMANYRRILEIDPQCRGLRSNVEARPGATTRTITLKRPREASPTSTGRGLRKIPFFTETMADLYMNQGYPRLAAEVFRRLLENNENPRLSEKLASAEGKIHRKES